MREKAGFKEQEPGAGVAANDVCRAGREASIQIK
jgi:hypothetical protein